MARPATKSSTTSKRLVDRVYRFFELERTFITFSIIYFPVAALFLTQGDIGRLLLDIYTGVMIFLAAFVIIRFVIMLARSANERTGNYGTLYGMYLLNVAVPLVMAKVFGYVIIRTLPRVHTGIVCEIKYFVLDVMNLLNYQHTLDVLLVGTFIAMTGLVLWSVGRK